MPLRSSPLELKQRCQGKLSNENIKSGAPSQLSGSDSVLPVQGVSSQFLTRKLRSHMLCSGAKTQNIVS